MLTVASWTDACGIEIDLRDDGDGCWLYDSGGTNLYFSREDAEQLCEALIAWLDMRPTMRPCSSRGLDTPLSVEVTAD